MKLRFNIALFASMLFFASTLHAEEKPNIIVILVDDLGNADLGYRGSKIKTPNIINPRNA